MRHLRGLIFIALFLSPAWCRAEAPDERVSEEARALFRRGVELAGQELWSEAERFFARSEELVPRASTSFNRALALHRLGRMKEVIVAVDRFLSLSDPERDQADRTAAVKLRELAAGMLASLRIAVTPPSATVLVDGEAASFGPDGAVAVDPGDRTLQIRAEGYSPQTLVVTVAASSERALEIRLHPARVPEPVEPASPTPPAPSPAGGPHIAPWVLLGAGALTLGAAAVTGVLALSADGELDRLCRGGACPGTAKDELDRRDRFALATDVLLGVGVALAGAGGVWLSLGGPKRGGEAASVTRIAARPLAGGGFVTVGETF